MQHFFTTSPFGIDINVVEFKCPFPCLLLQEILFLGEMNRRKARGGCSYRQHGASGGSAVNANLQSLGKTRVPVTTPSHTA